MDPKHDSARAIAQAVNSRSVSAAEIAETMIPHVAAVDEHIGAYLTLTPDLMRECARKADARIAAGEPDAASAAAVSGLDFTRTWRADGRVSLGDHLAAIPPYTGHGMALAL